MWEVANDSIVVFLFTCWSVFSIGSSPANYQIHAIYFLSTYFWYFVFNFMRRSAGAVQCYETFCGAVCVQNLGGAV